MNIIADITTDVPWSATSQWLFGALGFLGIVYLLFGVAIGARKLFGTRPPLDDQLLEVQKVLRAEFKAGDDSLRRSIETILEEIAEMNSTRLRLLSEIKNEIRELSNDVSFIRGRMENLPHSESH